MIEENIMIMSEMLERTWSFLTSSGSAPKWTVPSNQSSSTSHLPHGLSQFMKSVCQAPTSVVEAALVQKQLKAVKTPLGWVLIGSPAPNCEMGSERSHRSPSPKGKRYNGRGYRNKNPNFSKIDTKTRSTNTEYHTNNNNSCNMQNPVVIQPDGQDEIVLKGAFA